ncbi:MAG: MFS transporter [Erysipelotrichaceae bacterium]|nr:MFS transporter [Erysipelotrichaceae bacterium]
MEKTLKLNLKNTIKISFAFFAILMLWQAYNTYCPIILEAMLKEKVEHYNYIIGCIMALDNVAAIIIMPIVGIFSDKTKTKYGKRMPYIIIGMMLTVIVFPFIAIMCKLNSFVGVMIFMILFLIIMQAYRSPAVAFMPDITPKPLRSKANGIINLVGYLGGVFVTLLGFIPSLSLKKDSSLADVQGKVLWPFIICSVVFIAVLIYLLFAINENKMVEQTKDDVAKGEELSESLEEIKEDNKLSKADKKNFILILFAIFFWFMAFNSFETFGSLFTKNILNDSGLYGQMATFLSIASILSFIAFSSLSSKIGRKWTIVIGLGLLIVSLSSIAICSFAIDFSSGVGSLKILFYVLASIMGVGWALVNINSFPMVVEFANKDNVGKFTSFYYFASMVAQSITPLLVGLFMDFLGIGQKILFIYASALMIIALIVFLFIKEKKEVKERLRKQRKKSVLESLADSDN